MRDPMPASPPRRLLSRPWTEAGFAALDFETTGLDYERDHVVSFGVVPVGKGRIIVGGALHQLVEPAAPPTPVSVTVHGLRAQDLAGAPSLEEVRAALAAVLVERFVLAWFAQVEVAFLRRIFGGGARDWRRRTIDVRGVALSVEGRGAAGAGRYSLSAVASRYGVPVASPHDALDDALVTAQLFLVLASRLERGGRGAARTLLHLTHA